MRNKLYRAVNRTLAIVLAVSILMTGALAVKLTHVHAMVTVTFGDPVADKHIALADAIDVSQLTPLPQRKPVMGR